MADKGAINLVVTQAALDQITKLDRKLELVEKRIVKISNLARSSQGDFKNAGGKVDLNKQLQKQNNILIQIVKNNKKYHDALMDVAKAQKKVNEETNKGGKAMRNAQSRVGSFFKTLVAFDLARRAVDLFWGSFRKGFEDLKKLDSLRLQFQYLVKDATEARVTQAFLARTSEQLGVSILGLSESYLAFRKSAELANLSAEDSRQIFEDVTRAASLLGKSDAQIQNVQVALEQMLSKGTVQAEELKKQLGNVLPGSFEIMAKAVDELNPGMEVTNAEFNKMLKAGKIIAAEVLPEFAKQLKLAYGIENVDRIDTLQAATVRLDNAFTQMVANMEGGTGRMSKTMIFFFDVIRENIKLFGELFLSARELGNINKELGFETGFKQGQEELDKLTKKYGTDIEKIKKQAKALADEDAWGLNALYSQMESLIQLAEMDPTALWNKTGKTMSQVESEIKSLATQIGISEGFVKALDEGLKKLGESGKKAEEGLRPVAKELFNFKTNLENIEDIERWTKVYEAFQKTVKDPETAIALKKNIDLLKGFKEILEGEDVSGEAAEDFFKQYNKDTAKDIKRMGDALEPTIKQIEEWDKQVEELRDTYNDLDEAMVGNFADLAFSVTDAISEMRIAAIDREIEKLNERYDRNRELIELEVGDEEAKQERLRQLEKEKEIREKKLQKKREQAEKQAFLFNQAVSIGEIIMETAKGIALATATYGSNPATALLLPGVIGLMKATAAIQIGTVLAQSVPKFFKDGHLTGSYEGPAVINDGGKMEVIERRGGGLELYSSANQMISMKRGDKVHKSVDSFIKGGGAMDHLLNATTYAGGGIVKANQRKSEALGIKNEIREGFKNISIKNDNSSVGRIVAEAISDNRYESRFL